MKLEGFLFAAVEAGVRYADRLDLGLIYSESPCVAAGVFTTNQVIAAPVVIAKKRLEKHKTAQAILVNSGCANACTGEQGMQTGLHISKLLARELEADDELMLLSSTGVIGEQLSMHAFESNMKKLVDNLSQDGFKDVSKAIMTTDTVHKISKTKLKLGENEVTIIGMSKGAGMIMPNMATMLAFSRMVLVKRDKRESAANISSMAFMIVVLPVPLLPIKRTLPTLMRLRCL